MRAIVKLIAFCVWVSGIVIAHGFWSTFVAVFFPLWAWYLVAELLLKAAGVL